MEAKMTKVLGIAALAVVLGGCVYSPTPGPTVAAIPGGYTLNDNGYMAYYTPKTYPIPDCKNNVTWRCQDRLSYDAAFCAGWETSGRCGDTRTTGAAESNEIYLPPPGGRDEWWWVF
jgi:hypothetical protein